MALASQQIESILDQLDKFGDDDSAFDTWMNTIATQVRAHGHVGEFRTQTKTLWLARNKEGIRKIIWDIFSGPTTEERHAAKHGSRITEASFLDFCKKLGLRCGDTLTVHSEYGEIIELPINFEGLPHRIPPEFKKALKVAKKAATPKKPRKSRAKAKPKDVATDSER